MWVFYKAAVVLVLLFGSGVAEPEARPRSNFLDTLPPWMDDAWASILRKLYNQVQASVGFCLGADPDEILRLVRLSYQWPPPTLEPDDSKDPVCANTTLTAMHLCGPEDIEVYLRFMQLTDDPEKIPGTRHCVAGMPKDACAPGFYDPFTNSGDGARPCCPGYFCPNGLTCMMPCPLGAYCPLAVAKLPPPPFQTPGSLALWCAPYAYRRRPHLGCGGADRWAVIPQTAFPSTKWAAGSGNLYCPPGYYCPNTTHAIQCPQGRFCRQGTSSPERCPPGALCGPGTDVPINNYGGAAADAALLGVLAVLWWASTYKQTLRRMKDRDQEDGHGTQLKSGWITVGDDKEGLPICTTSLITRNSGHSGHSGTPIEPTTKPIDIKFQHISLRLRASGRLILSDVSANLRAARLTAVMGPSGSGKTSLLTALAGRATYAQMAGLVLVNGVPDRIQRYRRVTGFVPQDDVMHARLSVEENLLFAARLRLPAGTPASEHKGAVDGVIDALELGSVRKQLIGDVGVRGISGGQRKRVNVGLELVGRPRLLFLDEPTSGLDAAGTRGLVEILRRIVRSSGVTAAVIVHQPRHEAFSLFDDLLLLGGAGRTVYYGPVDHVEAYFSRIGVSLPLHTNPADALLDAITSAPKRLCDAWQAHELELDSDARQDDENFHPSSSMRDEVLDGDHSDEDDASDQDSIHGSLLPAVRQRDNSLRRPAPGFVSQYVWCLQRAILERSREPLQLFTDLAIIAAAGLTVGLLSDRGRATIMDYAAQMAYSVVAISLMAMVSAVGTFRNETVLCREAASGLNRVAYFLAMDSFDFSGAALRSAIYLITWYSFSNPKAVLWQLYAVVLALFYACSGMGYGLALALGAPSAQLGSAVLTLVSTLVARQPEGGTMLFLGQSLSASRWALEGLVIAESNQLTGVWLLARCADLAVLHYDVRRYWGCLGALVFMGLACRALALGILMNRVR